MFSAIALVVSLTVLIAVVAVSAFPSVDGSTEPRDEWLEAPMVGIVAALDGELPAWLVDVLRVMVGLSGALILLGAATTSISGCARLARSMASHGMLPREFGRLERRALVSREAILRSSPAAIVVVVVNGVHGDDDRVPCEPLLVRRAHRLRAGQLAVIRLRHQSPTSSDRSGRGPRSGSGARVPMAALIGVPLTFGVFVLSMVTHHGRTVCRALWLASASASSG